ncbi:hypothetical protein NPIL_477741 [Nephila pilipes]|uniref:Uncharacterized protein n=1 Tax=Nephila pilipes TaxID=299642 RepID=A0A8X6U8J9_NEPPI|nr:hypothetical protein NPIL_477741 [Nephila pilipes]
MKFAAKNSLSDGHSWFICSKLKLGRNIHAHVSTHLGFSYKQYTQPSNHSYKQPYHFPSATLVEWNQFIIEVILDYIENDFEKIEFFETGILKYNKFRTINL